MQDVSEVETAAKVDRDPGCNFCGWAARPSNGVRFAERSQDDCDPLLCTACAALKQRKMQVA